MNKKRFKIDEGAVLELYESETAVPFFLIENITDVEDFTEFLQLNISLPELIEKNITIKIELNKEDCEIFSTFEKESLLKYGLKEI